MSGLFGYQETRSPKHTTTVGYINRRGIDEKVVTHHPITKIDVRTPPVHGDHSSDYGYFRSGQTVTSDTPRSYHYTRKSRDGSETYDDYTVSREFSQDPLLPFAPRYPNSGYEGNCIAESITGALNGLDPDQTDLGASVAEGRQVVDQLAGSVKTMARAIIQAKRGNFGALPGILGIKPKDVVSGGSPANQWLAYQYGWKPLMSQIHAVQEKVHQVLIKDIPMRAVKTSSYTIDEAGPGWTMQNKVSSRTLLKASIRNVTSFSISSWGLINPLSIAWEVVPFSFVVDWLSPVGNTLSACSASVGLKFEGGCTSVLRSSTFRKFGMPGHSQNSTESYTVTEPGSTTAYAYEFQRFPYNAFPRPEFYADVTPFSTPRVASAAALIRQMM